MNGFSPDVATRSIVRLRSVDGDVLGTAFPIAPGLLLTCHHVVASLATVMAETYEGPEIECTVRKDRTLATADLAILAAKGETPAPLPISSHKALTGDWWTYGFRRTEAKNRSGLPARGHLSSTRSVSYAPGRQPYELEEVLTLEGGTIEEGFSGAPLFDADWGVVIGVVNADFTGKEDVAGFAIPIRMAAEIGTLARRLQQNAKSVIACGPYLNALAAELACRRQVRRLLAPLETGDVVVTDKRIPRLEVEKSVTKFVDSTSNVAVVIGDSGSGKTTELARLAETPFLSGRCLMVTGSDLHLGKSFSAILTQVLAESDEGCLPTDPLLVVGELLGTPDRPFVVILDALNEGASAIEDALYRWFGEALLTMERMRAKLILSCRPEYWDSIRMVIPERLIFGDPRSGISCRDFDDAEATAALAAYDLADTGLEADDVRHPLLLRIYAEQRRQGRTVHALSRYRALNEFASIKVHTVSRVSGLPVAAIRPPLIALATSVVNSGTRWLDESDVLRFFSASPTALQRLLEEGVLRSTDRRIGFVFEQIAELFASEALDPVDATEPSVVDRLHSSTSAPQYPGSVLFAILRVQSERQRDVSIVIERLSALALEREGWTAAWLVRQAFAELDSVEVHIPVFVSYLDALKDPFEARGFSRELARTRLSTNATFMLLRSLARHEWDSAWEPKHWDELSFDPGSEIPSVGDVASALLESDEKVAMSALLDWNTDRRTLHERPEVRVADVAQGLIFHHAARHPQSVLLAISGNDEYQALRYRLLDAQPEELLAIAADWVSKGTRPKFDAAIELARQAVLTGSLSAYHDRTGDILRAGYVKGDAEARRLMIAPLLVFPGTPRAVVEDAVSLYEAHDPDMPASLLGEGLNAHPCLVMNAFQRALKSTDDPVIEQEILFEVSGSIRPRLGPRRARLYLELYRPLIDRGDNTRARIATGLEFILNRLDPTSSAAAEAGDLAVELMRRGPSQVRSYVVAHATNDWTEVNEGTRQRILTELDRHPDEGLVVRAIDALLRLGSRYPGGWHWILKLGGHLPDPEFEIRILRAAGGVQGPWIDERLLATDPSEISVGLAAYLEARAAGESAPEASDARLKAIGS
jgi:hypothetical protein